MLSLALTPVVQADSETVETPAGTYYVVHSSDVGVRDRGICIGGCIFFPVPYANAAIRLYEESNGCQGLQQGAIVCPQTGQPVAADTRLV